MNGAATESTPPALASATPASCWTSSGERGAFRELHEDGGRDVSFMEDSTSGGNARARRASDSEVRRMLEDSLGGDWRAALPSAGIARRDEVLSELKSHGATVRQISRITGIGRGTVQKAKARQK